MPSMQELEVRVPSPLPELPSPSGTSYHTPVLSSPRSGASSPQLGSGGLDGGYPAIDESISILDPRRFTPTLHANLVSEILSLRRDVDARDALITDLEITLSETKTDNEQLTQRLNVQNREHRNVKRQLQQIEQSTVSALEELVKERDELKDVNQDLKSKLEDSNKRYKDREDDLQREFATIQRERDGWAGEQKRLERRVHVAEGRLRSVLDELAAHAGEGNVNLNGCRADSDDEETRDSGLGNESDGMSIKSLTQSPGKQRHKKKHSRNMSSASQRSLRAAFNRYSTTSIASLRLANGLSLADELNLDQFDEEDEDYADLDLEEDEDEFTEQELRELRAKRARESRMSSRMGFIDDKAKRILGITGELPAQAVGPNPSPTGQLAEAPGSTGDAALPKDMVLPTIPYEDQGFSMDTVGSERPIHPIEEVSGGEQETPHGHTRGDSKVLKEVTRLEAMRSTPSPTFGLDGVRTNRHGQEKRDSIRQDMFTKADERRPTFLTEEQVQERLDCLMKPTDDGLCRTCGHPWDRPSTEPSAIEEPQEEVQSVPAPTFTYVESGIQFSPPPSPEIQPTEVATLEISDSADARAASPTQLETQKPEVTMVSTAIQTVEEPLSPPATPKLSPPPSPSTDGKEAVEQPVEQQDVPPTPTRLPPPPPPQMVSIATQTDVEEPAEKEDSPEPPAPTPAPVPMSIPSIAIHPPDSRPTSLQSVMLPPGTKNVSCQTTFQSLIPMKSVSIQTDPIRIDQRLAKLPPHLLPSAISSKPSTPEVPKSSALSIAAGKKPAMGYTSEDDAPLAPQIPDDPQTEDRYPGNNDNGPLARTGKGDIIRRPFRDSSLFAGFNADEDSDLDGELSDDSMKRPTHHTPFSQTRGKLARALNFPTPVPEDKVVVSRFHESQEESYGTYPEGSQPERPSFSASTRSSFERQNKVSKSIRSGTGSVTRQPSIRRSAMIHSGTHAHIRSRSPSIGSIASSSVATTTTTTTAAGTSRPPPFPVPNRGSSRRLFSGSKSKSEGSQSPTPRSVTSSFVGRRVGPPRPLQQRDSLRKSRSAAPITRPVVSSQRVRSRSPPTSNGALSPLASPIDPTPQMPPVPSSMVRYQQAKRSHETGKTPSAVRPSREKLRTADIEPAAVLPTGNGAVESPTSGQASVVEAIAQTMVGEWMWKYVRRRKTFGVTNAQSQAAQDAAELKASEEGGAAVNGVMSGSGGQRHKRWVWLSPYERAIMWSSKQPTSGTALMGKSGRKLVIQSVLDVKDDTPLPKGATGTSFHRSILILTPARALKFTATTAERHYLWLTALSFLSHSAAGASDLANLPNVNLAINNIPSESAGSGFPGAPIVPQIPDGFDDAAPSPPPVSRTPGASLRRGGPIRDSVLLAKDKRPMPGSRHRKAAEPALPPQIPAVDSFISDAADAPTIPRFHTHGRKRSNTGPRIPPVNRGWGSYERSVTNPGPVPTTAYSGYSAASGPSYNAASQGGSTVSPPATGTSGNDRFIPWAVPTNVADCDSPPFLNADEVTGPIAPSVSSVAAVSVHSTGLPPTRRLNTSASAKEYGTWHAPSSGRTSRSSARQGPLTLNGINTLPPGYGMSSQPGSAMGSPSVPGFGGAGRSSEASSNRSSMLPNNFFEALGPGPGTMRMEAFIDRESGRGSEESSRFLGGAGRGQGMNGFLGNGKVKASGVGVGARRNHGQWSAGGNDLRRIGGVYGDEFESDPFRGF